MTFNQLIAYITAAKHLNVTCAAKELHISQSSVSKHLRLLQSDYNLKLYYKSKAGGIELTDSGRLFLSRAHKVMRALDALKTCANGATPTRATTHFAVGGTYALASELLPRLLSEFNKAHPLVSTGLQTGSSFTIHDGVLRGDIELGVVSKPPRSKHLEVQPYSTHTLVAFVSKKHPYARKGELTPAELARAPLVVRGGPRLQSSPEIALRQRGYKANVVSRCDTPEAVRIAVRNESGVGILFYDAVKNAIKRGEFKLLRTPGLVIEAKSFVVYHKERPLSVNAKDFLTLLKQKKPEPNDSRKICGGGGNLSLFLHDAYRAGDAKEPT